MRAGLLCVKREDRIGPRGAPSGHQTSHQGNQPKTQGGNEERDRIG